MDLTNTGMTEKQKKQFDLAKETLMEEYRAKVLEAKNKILENK